MSWLSIIIIITE